MKSFNKIKQTIKSFFENVKLIKIDKDNRKKFINEMGLLVSNPSSKYNLYKMSINEDYTKLSCYITIPENFQLAGTDAMIYTKLKEESRPINEYIGRDLVWGEYFKSPEFFYIDDVDDTENVSCTYLAIWEFAPVLEKYPSFKYQFAAFIGINIILLGAVAFGITLLF